MAEQRLKHFGWGREGEGMTPAEETAALDRYRHLFGVDGFDERRPPPHSKIELRPPRLVAPASLAACCSTELYDRAAHTYGKSFSDYARGLAGEYANAPDVVAYPRDEAEIVAVLDWAGSAEAALIPFGGGSSVVGGVEPRIDGTPFRASISLDLGHLNRVVEIDPISRAARIEAGVLGPALEAQLRPHGLTLRHFPQSFEYSTLGGWIATRSGGHFATLYTHIDEFVESLRVVTPRGVVETRRLPGSGAGPSPDRLFIGSEGILGVITQAWMRLQDRPRFRAGGALRFPGEDGFARGAEAARRLAQSGLHPANCRLLDALEAANSGAGSGTEAVLLVAFESADHPLEAWTARALEIAVDAGGIAPPEGARMQSGEEGARGGAAGAWRNAFLNAPYLRDVLARASVVSETFETAIPWDRFAEFHAGVMEAALDAVKRACGTGTVAVRFTHVYPDGPAPYYTIL